jgi:hypothetical protein
VPGRYLQYGADLASTDPAVTPELLDVAVACAVTPDMTAPVITAVTATPASNGQSATIAWTTDEGAGSVVDYGTTAALGTSANDATLVTAHSMLITGLSPGVTYHYRVRSADVWSNEATEPAPPAVPLTFTTPLQPCFVDNTAGEFGAGTLDSVQVTSTIGDGEVTLSPALLEEFAGTGLPADWASGPWTGGTATVSGGVLTVDGAHAQTSATFARGRVLEYVATYANVNFQNVGFAADGEFNSPWVVIGRGSGNPAGVYARAHTGASVLLSSTAVGAAHRYGIEWKADGTFAFSIDGVVIPTPGFTVTVTSNMVVMTSDYENGGAALTVDWVRMTPYAVDGAFTSRVYDAGTPSSWGAMSWTADVPGGTTLAMSVRKGDTPVPDGTWSAWTPVATSGDLVGGVARYVQYAATMSSSVDGTLSPVLRDVGITCGACNAGAPAVIADLGAVATGNAGGGRTHVKLTWSGVDAGHAVAVYRKAFGDYPLYRNTHGAVPTVPATPQDAVAAGWTLSAVTTSTGLDTLPTRDQWFHVAFVTNACGVTSGPSNLPAGTLDYLLGDVSDGSAVCTSGGAGDAQVSTPDLSALGGNYGQTFPPEDARACLDVGPTVDYGLRSRPAPDGRLNFEDLVLYALNFGVPLPSATAALAPAAGPGASGGADELSLVASSSVRAGERFDIVMSFHGTGAVRALSARLAWNAGAVEFLGVVPGAMLAAAGGVALAPEPGTVDVAVLGARTTGLTGEGVLAVVSFRALRDGDPGIRLGSAIARDAANRPVALGEPTGGGTPVVHTTRLGPVFPNPFRGALNVSFSLARDTRTSVVVYDLAGRAVRHLENGVRVAGSHVITWDGRLDAGSQAPAGVYVIRFQAGDVQQTRRVQLIP